MAQEFNEVADELDRAQVREGTHTNMDALRRRKQTLQDEMLMLLRQGPRLWGVTPRTEDNAQATTNSGP